MVRLLYICYIAALLAVLCTSVGVRAQENEVPLGDLAREVRSSKPPEKEEVIDNDNFAVMMDKAESKRLEGKPIFAVSPSGRTFTAISPDGTCSLSFDAKSVNKTLAAYIASDLPQDELLKLSGPATIQDGMLEVSVHNGTQWELKEIVVGMTVLQTQTGPEYRPATLESAPASVAEKAPDLTVLYHLKENAPPDSTTVFRGALGGNFRDAQDWHWAIVAARGIPPAAPAAIVQSAVPPSISQSEAVTPSAPSISKDSSLMKPSSDAPVPAVLPPPNSDHR